jgi:hypothetical protein
VRVKARSSFCEKSYRTADYQLEFSQDAEVTLGAIIIRVKKNQGQNGSRVLVPQHIGKMLQIQVSDWERDVASISDFPETRAKRTILINYADLGLIWENYSEPSQSEGSFLLCIRSRSTRHSRPGSQAWSEPIAHEEAFAIRERVSSKL